MKIKLTLYTRRIHNLLHIFEMKLLHELVFAAPDVGDIMATTEMVKIKNNT